MSYELYDANGRISDLASNSGLTALTQFVDSQQGVPALKQFLDSGYSTDLDGVKTDVYQLLFQAPTDIDSVLQGIGTAVAKADEVLILSHEQDSSDSSDVDAAAESGNFPDTGDYDEKREKHVRKELGIWVAYAEDGPSFDPNGKYQCRSCDMRDEPRSCTHVYGTISMEAGSCRLYIHGPELEGKPPLKQKLTQIESDYAERPKTKAFGCQNCEYGAKAKKPDSDGRPSWCSFWGVHVQPLACCAMEDGPDMIKAPGEKEVNAAAEQSAQNEGTLWHGIKIVGFTGPEEEGLRAMLSRIPPELLTNVKEIHEAKELNAKHGRYIPDTKTMLFNPHNFALRTKLGRGDGRVQHQEITLVHEVGHSIWDSLSPTLQRQWRALSGWTKTAKEGQAPAYIETRPGWEPFTSKWTHKFGVKFTRYYAEKSPNEDFADSFAFYLLGKAHQVDPGKKRFLNALIQHRVKKYPQAAIHSPERPYAERYLSK